MRARVHTLIGFVRVCACVCERENDNRKMYVLCYTELENHTDTKLEPFIHGINICKLFQFYRLLFNILMNILTRPMFQLSNTLYEAIEYSNLFHVFHILLPCFSLCRVYEFAGVCF